MYRTSKLILALASTAFAFVLPACAADSGNAAAKLETEDQKTLYAMGLAIAQNLAQYKLSEQELTFLEQGLTDGILGHEAKVALSEYGPKIQPFAQQRAQAAAAAEREAAAAFLAEQEKKPGAVKTDSGLIYTEVAAGDGPSPKADDTVTVDYEGTLRSGTVFDSSKERGQPATFQLDKVIPCWTEGVQRMKVGGKARLVCPPDLAYGDRAAGSIPPGSALVFEVELLKIGGGEEGGGSSH
jgi:FKBP-type peptidyl-prolyl cis-trans isomerase FkpA